MYGVKDIIKLFNSYADEYFETFTPRDELCKMFVTLFGTKPDSNLSKETLIMILRNKVKEVSYGQ